MSGPVGILGGTFDPVHLGHTTVARECAEQLHLDGVVMVPSFLPPHRQPPQAAAPDRMAMVTLAAAEGRGLEADDVEVRRGGTSYAVDTVHALRARWPDRELVLLLGVDAALEFGSWQRPAEITRAATVVVFSRAGWPVPAGGLATVGLPAARLLEVNSPPVSATDIRARLAAGEPVEQMLPPSVLGYIREHGLYGARG